MEQKKIGKLISIIRKDKQLTQQQLGDILGVSSKTISKWETGNGLPDITILKKISKEFDITIDELLDGEIEIKHPTDNKTKSTKYKIITTIFILIILATITISIINSKKANKEESITPQNNCTVIRTYDIKNIGESNDENYRYITISEYQVEGVFTVKIPKSISEKLKSGSAYVFTFKTTEANNYTTTDKLFDNSEIINIKYTDKLGMERESRSYCDNIVSE